MIQRDADRPLLVAEGLSKWYGKQLGCRDVSFALYPGEVIAVVGESGSGKSTLLQLLSSQLESSSGRVLYRMRDGVTRDLAALGEAERRFLLRTDWGYVHQDPTCGLRMTVSAGANVGERRIALGWRHDCPLRSTAGDWLGCRLPAISSPSRASCSWMSRPGGLMCRCRRGCSICCEDLWPSSRSRR